MQDKDIEPTDAEIDQFETAYAALLNDCEVLMEEGGIDTGILLDAVKAVNDTIAYRSPRDLEMFDAERARKTFADIEDAKQEDN